MSLSPAPKPFLNFPSPRADAFGLRATASHLKTHRFRWSPDQRCRVFMGALFVTVIEDKRKMFSS
jgi:hypothetical protein